MKPKEAVAAAKKYIQEVFADEQITDLGLEEIEFEDEQHCRITIGFSRPWNKTNGSNQTVRQQMEAIAHAIKETPARRDYKVVTLKDEDGKVTVVSVKNRELQTAA